MDASTSLALKKSPLPGAKVLGMCEHFGGTLVQGSSDDLVYCFFRTKRRSMAPDRYDLCAIYLQSDSDRGFDSDEAKHFAALIAHSIFSSRPVLEITLSGIPRSRRQFAGL
ncbi:MAG: hypothetical protein WDN50_12630 [Bradyrhizobium sp.]